MILKVRIKRYDIGEISDEKINNIYVIIENKGKYLITTDDGKKWNFILKKINTKAGYNSLLKKIESEVKILDLKIIPVYIYEIDNDFVKVYYCYNNEKTIIETEQRYKLISKEEVDKYLNKEFYTIFNECISSRRILNKWYLQDSRKTIGRVNHIETDKGTIFFKESIADPINIVETLKAYFKKDKINGPIQLDINPLSKCCDRCIFCFNEEDRKNSIQELNYEETLNCINWLIQNTDLMHIKSSGFGEPTLYTNIWNLFKYTRSKGLYNTLNTNGFGLNENIDNILKTLDSIRFSIDAYDEISFEKVHNCKDFKKRKEDIELLVKRREKEQQELIIGLHYVLLPENYKGLYDLITWSKQIGIDYIDITLGKFKTTYLYNWNEHELLEAIDLMKKAKQFISSDFNVILPHKETLNEIDLENFREKRYNNQKCWQIFLRQYITPSGEYGACNAFESQPIKKRVFGNIYNDDMSEIFSKIKENNLECKKNKNCKYCVIPHGAFNDLCDIIYKENISK